MSWSHKRKGRRGAAVIYILAMMSILLLVFTATFQSFHVLRQVNKNALETLQKEANQLKIQRPHTDK